MPIKSANLEHESNATIPHTPVVGAQYDYKHNCDTYTGVHDNHAMKQLDDAL